jgi:hypothetical protein
MLNALSNPPPTGTTSLVVGGGQFPLNSVVSGSGGTGKLKFDCVSDPLALKFDNCPSAISLTPQDPTNLLLSGCELLSPPIYYFH